MTILSWRCPVHGATADPLLLGGHVYCPDEGCTREITRDRAAEARTISVVTLWPRNRPGSVRMRVVAYMRAHAGRVVTWHDVADAIAQQTGRRPSQPSIGMAFTALQRRGVVEPACHGPARHAGKLWRRGAGGWRWIGEA